jgi:hypothetical protein
MISTPWLQAGTVADQMEVLCAIEVCWLNLQATRPAAQGRMIGHGKIDPKHVHDGTDQLLALAQRQTKHNAQSQSRLDLQCRIANRVTGKLRILGSSGQGFLSDPATDSGASGHPERVRI